MNNYKKTYIEALRIIALVFVFFNHTGDNGFYLYTSVDNTIIQAIYLSISFLSRIAVPIFFMISGGLLIGRNEIYSELFNKRILRVLIILILFSSINYLFTLKGDISDFSISYFLQTLYSSEIIQSYWYLYYYIGFLIFLPFLRKMVISMQKNDFFYLFTICFIFQVIFSFIDAYFNVYHNSYVNSVFLEWFFLYPLAGYYFETLFDYKKVKKTLVLLTFMSSLCILATLLFTKNEMNITNNLTTQRYMSLFVAIPAITTYLLIKSYFMKYSLPRIIEKVIIFFGSTTFGCYLINEILILNIYNPVFYLLNKTISPIFACFFCIIICIVIGGGIIFLLKKLPIFRKIM